MKRKRIIIAASVPLVAFAVCAYLYNEHPLTLKLLNGSSRVLSPVRTTVKMDGQIQTTAKCFAMKTLFNGKPTDSLVIWLPNASSHYGREILMINRNEKLAGMPNSSNIQYEDLNRIEVVLKQRAASLNVPLHRSRARWFLMMPSCYSDYACIKRAAPVTTSLAGQTRLSTSQSAG